MPGLERPDRFEIGDWIVDPSIDEILTQGGATKLEPRMMRLLVCLAESHGQVVSSQRLLDEVWAGVVVGPGAVYQSVSQLRKLLGDTDFPPKYIATVPRKGYRLLPQVRWLGRASASQGAAQQGDSNVAADVPPPPARPAQRTGRVGMVIATTLAAALLSLLAGRHWAPSQPAAASHTAVAAPPGAGSVRAAIADKSIAVLPLADLSEKQDAGYLADGMAEEILDLLSKIPAMQVIARTSSFQFKGRNADVRQVGQTLGAAFVLEGSVRRSQDRLRIAVQLIDTHDGTHRWSDSYDRPVGDALQVQADIAAAVARAVQLTIDGEAIRAHIGSVDSRAYELFLRARYVLDRAGREDLEEGCAYLEQALSLDPGFARAATQLAAARAAAVLETFDMSEAGIARALAAIERALRLGYRSADMHAYRAALYQFYDLDWGAAQAEMERALRLEPSSAIVLGFAGLLATGLGRADEAARYLRTALRQDPLNVSLIGPWEELLLLTGRYREAQEQGQRALAISSSLLWSRFWLGEAALALGDRQAALEAFEHTGHAPARLAGLAAVHYAMGHHVESDRFMQQLERQAADTDAYLIAKAHAYRHELDAALRWLERASRQKDTNIANGPGDPAFVRYADDPRYRAWLNRTYPPRSSRRPLDSQAEAAAAP
jgi:transcriptional activator of cad operon